MNFFKKIAALSTDELKSVASLCAGMALLAAIALVLSGSLPFLPQQLKVALQQGTSQSAAVWWSQDPYYDGYWPAWHVCTGYGSTCPAGGWYGTLPSYADIFVTSNPSQNIIAKVVLSKNLGWGARNYSGPTYTGSIPTVPSGTSLTIEWSCQDFQTQYYGGSGCSSYDSFGNCNDWYGTGGSQSFLDYSSTVGTNFSTEGAMYGSAVVTPQITTTYGVQCIANPSGQLSPPSGYGAYPLSDTPVMSFTIEVNSLPLPTLTITGNGMANAVTTYTNQPVTVAATFAAGSGDSLTGTAINDYQSNLWCGTGNTCNSSMWTASPMGSKSYTFTPTAAGEYIFYPAAQTTNYPLWDNYSQSLTVTVVGQCPNGQGLAGSCTSCNSGYLLQEDTVAQTVQTYFTSGTNWTVPSDWNSSNNSIEVIGGGGGGGISNGSSAGTGGGGGGYSKVTNQSLTPGGSVIYAVGAGGAASTAGGDTYFCNSTSNCASISGTAVVVGAKAGGAGSNYPTHGIGSPGGASGTGGPVFVASTTYSGGSGGGYQSGGYAGGGGGGAGGPNGTGAAGGFGGGTGGSSASGGGGGGSGGGSAGSTGATSIGGAGGNNSSATGGGSAGSAGSNGGGGGGGSGPAGATGAGGAGIEWDGTHGSGGGGGGGPGGGNITGGAGALYGAGGGGGSCGTGGCGSGGAGGAGAQGIVVIKYVSPASNSCVPQCPNGQGVAGSCTSCNSGYTLQGGNCIQPSGNITTQLTATPVRVRASGVGGSTTLTWGTSSMTSCTLKDEANTTLSTALSNSTGLVVSGIKTKKVFTLSCTDGASTYPPSTATVTLVPSVIEI